MNRRFLLLPILLIAISAIFANPYSGGVSLFVIDAGHGGKDPGAQGYGKNEKDINLSVSALVAHNLEAEGKSVLLTRDDDTFLELQERCDRANSATFSKDGYPLFVSIHVNSAQNSDASGFEVYIKDDAKKVPMLSRKTNPVLLSKYSSYTPSQLNRYKDLVSRRVADSVVSSVQRAFPSSRIRGVKEGDLYVLNCTWMPSILIELGFISNEDENARLVDTAWQKKMAKAISDALLQY